MENKDLIKEAVKAEVVKLMAQELLKEDSFEKMKSELAAEIFSSKESKEDSSPAEPTEPSQPAKTAILRELNSEWGYDPINKKEEKMKRLLGFLPNLKDIGRGFKGQEITEEEYNFMLNSSFTKKAIIKELEEKIKDLKKGITEDDDFDNFGKKLNEKELSIFSQTASEKLEDFKSKFYGSPLPENTLEEKVKKIKQTELKKLHESASASALEVYKDIHIPEIESAAEIVKKPIAPKKKRAPRKVTKKKK